MLFRRTKLIKVDGTKTRRNRDGHSLIPGTTKFSVSNWMNPKANSDRSVTIYMQPTSPGSDKEINWLPTTGIIPMMTPLMASTGHCHLL